MSPDRRRRAAMPTRPIPYTTVAQDGETAAAERAESEQMFADGTNAFANEEPTVVL